MKLLALLLGTYFVTAEPPDKVVRHFAAQFRRQGLPVRVDRNVVSAFDTRARRIHSVVLMPQGGKTVGFIAVKTWEGEREMGLGLLLVALAAAPNGLSEARVGQWVTYQVQKKAYWRLAVVAEEKDERGRDALWIELELGDHSSLAAPLQQVRMLVAREAGFTREGVTRIVAGMGMDTPSEVSGLPFVAPQPELRGAAIREGGLTKLSTAAGTVDAAPLEIRTTSGVVLQRLWISKQIPLLHLARIEMPQAQLSIEVIEHGSDAKPRMVLTDASAK